MMLVIIILFQTLVACRPSPSSKETKAQESKAKDKQTSTSNTVQLSKEDEAQYQKMQKIVYNGKGMFAQFDPDITDSSSEKSRRYNT